MDVGGKARIIIECGDETLCHVFDLEGFLRKYQGKLLTLTRDLERITDDRERIEFLEGLWSAYCVSVEGYTIGVQPVTVLDDWQSLIPAQHRAVALRIFLQEASTGGRPATDPRRSAKLQPGDGATAEPVQANSTGKIVINTQSTGIARPATSDEEQPTTRLTG